MAITLTKEITQLDGELLTSVTNKPQPDGRPTYRHGSSAPFLNEFQAPVSSDLTPPGSVCDWCGHAGERRLTAIGASSHNTSGVFCRPCGQLFIEKIVNSQHTH